MAKNIGVAHYRHCNLLLMVNQNNAPKLPGRNLSNAHVLSFAQSLRASRFKHTRETLFIATTAMTNRSEACKCASWDTLCVPKEATPVALLGGRQQILALSDLQKAKNVARIKTLLPVRCATRQSGRQIVKTESLTLGSLANNVTRAVGRDSFFVAVAKFVMSLGAAFERKRCVCFLATRIVIIVDQILFFRYLDGK